MNQRAPVAAQLVAVVLLAPVLASAQSETEAPRTPWGDPDLQGVWDFRTITPLQRPEEFGDQPFLTAEEAATLEQQAVDRNVRLWNEARRPTEAGGNVGAYNNFWMDRGTRTVPSLRTSLIVDPPTGRIPPLSGAAQARADARTLYQRDHPADSWEDRSVAERCVLGFNSGPPMEPRAYNNHMQLFQTADHVVILNEMVHDVRIIPLSAADPLPESVPQWKGHSRARWEGETLVVDTTNFYNKNSFTERHGGTASMTLQERFRRVDADTLAYEFTVDDPATWTRPWTVEMPMLRSDDQLWEYACHEGNYGMDGILAGHRAEERAADDYQPDILVTLERRVTSFLCRWLVEQDPAGAIKSHLSDKAQNDSTLRFDDSGTAHQESTQCTETNRSERLARLIAQFGIAQFGPNTDPELFYFLNTERNTNLDTFWEMPQLHHYDVTHWSDISWTASGVPTHHDISPHFLEEQEIIAMRAVLGRFKATPEQEDSALILMLWTHETSSGESKWNLWGVIPVLTQ